MIHNFQVRSRGEHASVPVATTANGAHFGGKNIGWQALGPAIACTVLSTTVVAMRWYTRAKIVCCIGSDDVVILLSLVLAWCICGLIAAEVSEGVGNYGARDAEAIAKLVVACNAVWTLTVNVTKCSILVQYLRVFSSKWMRVCTYILMSLLLPAALYTILYGTLICHPVAKIWRPELRGHCGSAESYWLSAASTNIGLDFLVLLLPLPAMAGLHLPRKQKLWLVLVFLLGFFVSAVSVVRLVTVYATAKQGEWVKSGVWAIVWSAVEANVGIICASLLALKPLVLRLFPSLMEENEVPSHCMRINTITTDEPLCWRNDSGSASAASPGQCDDNIEVLEASISGEGEEIFVNLRSHD